MATTGPLRLGAGTQGVTFRVVLGEAMLGEVRCHDVQLACLNTSWYGSFVCSDFLGHDHKRRSFVRRPGRDNHCLDTRHVPLAGARDGLDCSRVLDAANGIIVDNVLAASALQA